MITSLNFSQLLAASTSRAKPADERPAGTDAMPTFVRSQGRTVGISKSRVNTDKERLSSEQGLMLDKAVRALAGQEPIMKFTQHATGGAFEFASGLGSAHNAAYEHDGRSITKLTVYDRAGNALAETDARGPSAQALGKRKRISSSQGTYIAQSSRSRGPLPAHPTAIHQTILPSLVHVEGRQFQVGPLSQKIDPYQQDNLLKALLAEPKIVVSDNLHQGDRSLSFTAHIDNTEQFITLEMDREGNLRGAAGTAFAMGTHKPSFSATFGSVAARPRFAMQVDTIPNQRPLASKIQDPRNLSMPGNGTSMIQGVELRRSALGATSPLPPEKAIALNNYLSSIIFSGKISQTHVLIARNYLDRLPQAVFSQFDLTQLAAGCLTLAMKYGNDATRSPNTWSRITGLSKDSLMHTEISIVKALGFNMSVGDVGPE